MGAGLELLLLSERGPPKRIPKILELKVKAGMVPSEWETVSEPR